MPIIPTRENDGRKREEEEEEDTGMENPRVAANPVRVSGERERERERKKAHSFYFAL